MRRLLALAALLLVLSPGSSRAGIFDPKGKPIDDFLIELEGRYWFGKLSGEISADTEDIDGTGIDFSDELDIETPVKPMIELAARLRLKAFIIRGSYFQSGFAEKTRLERTVTFEGLTFSVGTEVKSRATVHFGGLDAMALLLDTGSASTFGLRVGAGIGGRYLGFKGAISSTATGLSESTKGGGVIPVIAIGASVGLFNIISINVDAAAMKIPGVDYLKVEGTFVDATAAVRVYLHHLVYVTGGYRFLMLKASFHDKEVNLDTKLQGFFVGVGVSF